MSAQQGGNDETEVVESFKEALKQRIGADHFRMWFTHGVSVSVQTSQITETDISVMGHRLLVRVRGRFALDRLQKKFIREIRAAGVAGCGPQTRVALELDQRTPIQPELPLQPHGDGDVANASLSNDASADKDSSACKDGLRVSIDTCNSTDASRTTVTAAGRRGGPGGRTKRPQGRPRRVSAAVTQLELPDPGCPSTPGDRNSSSSGGLVRSGDNASVTAEPGRERRTAETFVVGSCNRLAHTAMVMAIQQPGSASPLFLCGPTGTGKTHLLSAMAEQFRRRHRMRRVIHLSAEQFTNDFISSVGNSGIASFRRRYREVDALLVDDVQFLGAKRATLREMLYTVETLLSANRPLIFTANEAPTEIPGLTRELAGRMASGLLCPVQALDPTTRESLLRRAFQERCQLEVPEHVVTTINAVLVGDGRVVSGVANLVNTLQRMFNRMPCMEEIRQFGGDLLRASKPITNLTTIEQAVCETFQLPETALRASSQSRSLSEPRMLAMHLSRELTSAAFAEIGAHYGGRSHSTAIAAGKNVHQWLKIGKSIGRGHAAMTVQEAIDRIETRLRSG